MESASFLLVALPLGCQRILIMCDCGACISWHAHELLARDKRVSVVMRWSAHLVVLDVAG